MTMPDDKGRGEREICERLVHLRDTMRNGKPQAYHRDHLDTLADAVNALQALEQQLNEARRRIEALEGLLAQEVSGHTATLRANNSGQQARMAAERREEGLREAARALLDAMYEHGPDGAEIARAADRLAALASPDSSEGS